MAETVEERLLTRTEVSRRTALPRSTLYRLVAESRFPAPVQIGPATSRWLESEVIAWISALPRWKTGQRASRDSAAA